MALLLFAGLARADSSVIIHLGGPFSEVERACSLAHPRFETVNALTLKQWFARAEAPHCEVVYDPPGVLPAELVIGPRTITPN